MRGGVRAALVLGVVLVGLLSVAPAWAEDPRIPLPTPDPVVLEGYCDFPVLLSYTRSKQYIIHQTTAPDGTTTLKITGNAVATVKNLDTGKLLTYNISGPGTVVIRPNGSFGVNAGGPNLFYTLPENSFPGVPTLSYTTGRVAFQVDPSGKTTTYSLRGHQTDVCAALAS
ncbi:MAG: hypothetical protein LC777_16050 [Actinobacteria bacterium]|nr:hypothetical protein [Actinomycetota bacterium]